MSAGAGPAPVWIFSTQPVAFWHPGLSGDTSLRWVKKLLEATWGRAGNVFVEHKHVRGVSRCCFTSALRGELEFSVGFFSGGGWMLKFTQAAAVSSSTYLSIKANAFVWLLVLARCYLLNTCFENTMFSQPAVRFTYPGDIQCISQLQFESSQLLRASSGCMMTGWKRIRWEVFKVDLPDFRLEISASCLVR